MQQVIKPVFINSTSKRLLSYLLCMIFVIAAPVAAAEIKNLQTGQQENRAFAVYDLVGKPGEMTAEVRIVLEIGGERYDATKLAVSGDYGKAVKVGTRKTVYWDVIKDMPSGFEGDLFWNVDVIAPVSKPVSGLSAPVHDSATTAAKELIEPAAHIELVQLPAGCFTMGADTGNGESDEKPPHEVCLDSFSIGKFEVTQAQWQSVMGTNPSYFKKCGQNCPVENISWGDAARFLKKLNSLTGKSYRLPTEAEWEYAARSGGKVQRFSGATERVAALGWYELNANAVTHPVGEKQANELGIFDMSGNVAEWVQDWKGAYPSEAVKNPSGQSTGKYRVVRGGAWLDDLDSLRTTFRSELNPNVRTNLIGMRVLLPSP